VSGGRTAGILYLIIAAASTFAIAYVPSVIGVDLAAHRALFGLGVVADVVIMLTEIVLSVLLFVLLEPVSRTLSLIALASRLMVVVVMAINLLIHVIAMVLSSREEPTAVLALLEAHRYGVYIWDVFFGFHLAVLGYLVLRSGRFPRLLGAAMMLGSLGYFFAGLFEVAFVDSAMAATFVVGLLVIATLAELAFAFWLTCDSRGVRSLRGDVRRKR
jgi:Domain of unknown function (DUF4386)